MFEDILNLSCLLTNFKDCPLIKLVLNQKLIMQYYIARRYS